MLNKNKCDGQNDHHSPYHVVIVYLKGNKSDIENHCFLLFWLNSKYKLRLVKLLLNFTKVRNLYFFLSSRNSDSVHPTYNIID